MAVEDLEAQLRADPDDQVTWKVYGDWLLAHGDERGELIQRGVDDERMQPRWQGGIDSWSVATARYGFVTGLRASPEDAARMLALPEARLVSTLRISDGDKLEALCAADLSGLATLELRYLEVHAEGARMIASARLDGLRRLDLRYALIGDAGASALAGAAPLAGLRELHLQRNDIGTDGARAIAESRYLTRLELLDLRHNTIGSAGARALAQSPNAAHLATLRVHREDLGDGGAAELGRSPHLPVATRRIWRAA
jgi:uncharacterized protein (TIGR02996 family)